MLLIVAIVGTIVAPWHPLGMLTNAVQTLAGVLLPGATVRRYDEIEVTLAADR